jgi:hypothetical protein
VDFSRSLDESVRGAGATTTVGSGFRLGTPDDGAVGAGVVIFAVLMVGS